MTDKDCLIMEDSSKEKVEEIVTKEYPTEWLNALTYSIIIDPNFHEINEQLNDFFCIFGLNNTIEE